MAKSARPAHSPRVQRVAIDVATGQLDLRVHFGVLCLRAGLSCKDWEPWASSGKLTSVRCWQAALVLLCWPGRLVLAEAPQRPDGSAATEALAALCGSDELAQRRSADALTALERRAPLALAELPETELVRGVPCQRRFFTPRLADELGPSLGGALLASDPRVDAVAATVAARRWFGQAALWPQDARLRERVSWAFLQVLERAEASARANVSVRRALLAESEALWRTMSGKAPVAAQRLPNTMIQQALVSRHLAAVQRLRDRLASEPL